VERRRPRRLARRRPGAAFPGSYAAAGRRRSSRRDGGGPAAGTPPVQSLRQGFLLETLLAGARVIVFRHESGGKPPHFQSGAVRAAGLHATRRIDGRRFKRCDSATGRLGHPLEIN